MSDKDRQSPIGQTEQTEVNEPAQEQTSEAVPAEVTADAEQTAENATAEPTTEEPATDAVQETVEATGTAAAEEQGEVAETAAAEQGEVAETAAADQGEVAETAAEEQAEEPAAATQQEDGEKPEEKEMKDEEPKEKADVTDEKQETLEGEQQPAAEQEQETAADTQKETNQEAEPAAVAEGEAKQSSPEPLQETKGTDPEPNPDVQEVDPHAPSPEPKVDKDATATVKFVMMPSGQVATLRCNLSQTLAELKDHFGSELKMAANLILLMFDGKSMDDKVTLAELGVGPNGTVQLEMQSADPVNTPLRSFRPRQEYHMPDVITVRVQSEDGTYTDVVVEIERATKKKPFLGGYRHKKTSVEFHHASAQTMGKQRPPPSVERFCRDTQTYETKHRRQQTTNDMSTQMTKIGVFVANMEDKLVIPGKYTTAEEFKWTVLKKVIIIQKYYRRWLAKKAVDKIKKDKENRLEWERQEEIRKKREKEERIRKEFERRMNPKSKEDFDLLYHALEKWRTEEQDHINQTLTGAERKAALCQLLEQETQLIASIGRHKIEADKDNKSKRIQKFLDKASAPKQWKSYDGKTTEMDTPYTIRAQELKDIYASINMKFLTQDERLDVLLTLKHTVKEHDCKLTQEIIELIDREADLLMRGVKESNMDGLRKRISTLFLQYIRTPVFNPEAARLLKVPQDPSSLRKNIYFCPSCNQYLPSTEFQLSSNSRVVGKCRRCNKIDNDGRTRQDFSHYRYMLKALRRSEENYGDASKIAFLLQESDLRYLVENVWSTQSILSAWDDLYDLVLVRWDKHQEWSPWNCILLTKEEASSHEKLEDLDEGYGSVFIHKVEHKHTLARNYFSRLPGMAEHMRVKDTRSAVHGPKISGKAVRQMQPASA